MSYYRFTVEYVVLSGGISRYQSVFERIVRIAISAEMYTHSVYFYSAESREVYLTKLAYLQICRLFPDMQNNLEPIAELSMEKGDQTLTLNFIIADCLTLMMDGTAIITKTVNEKTVEKTLCCALTGAEIAVFPATYLCTRIKIFLSKHKSAIVDAINLMKYIVKSHQINHCITSEIETKAILMKLYRKYSDKRCSQYDVTKWAIKNYIVENYKYFDQSQYELFKYYCERMIENVDQTFLSISDVLNKIFSMESSGDAVKAFGLASEERSIISQINELTGENYPLADYKFNDGEFSRNGIIVSENGSAVIRQNLSKFHSDKNGDGIVTYFGITLRDIVNNYCDDFNNNFTMVKSDE